MSCPSQLELPTDSLQERRNELEMLAGSKLPVSDHAERLLELLDKERKTQ